MKIIIYSMFFIFCTYGVTCDKTQYIYINSSFTDEIETDDDFNNIDSLFLIRSLDKEKYPLMITGDTYSHGFKMGTELSKCTSKNKEKILSTFYDCEDYIN